MGAKRIQSYRPKGFWARLKCCRSGTSLSRDGFLCSSARAGLAILARWHLVLELRHPHVTTSKVKAGGIYEHMFD